ncbi:MFS transporter [Candidatus Poriferisocius sp.]|uniref:MFS transporter n=1 Tax=Candidatus Poriferisocius sp. TaxID=3101276 RepID=UPI003B02841A
MSDAAPASTTGMFASLSNREYALLWWSGLVAFLAVGMQILARGWLAIQLTDSNSSFALVLLAFGIGMVTVTPFGGVAADRFPRRALIVGSHVSLSLSALWLGIMVVLGLEQFWMLLLTALIQGSSFAFMGPARIAMTGEVVERELLSNAISLTQLTVASSQTVGPALAGVLADTPGFGLAGVYLLSAGLTALGTIPVLMLPKSRPQQREANSPFEEIAAGVSYVARQPYLRVVVISTALMLLVAMPYMAFLPKFTESVFGVGALWLGILQGANALGGTVTALQVARMRDNSLLWRLRVFSLATVAVGVGVLAVTPNHLVALPVLFFLGGAATTFQTANMSMSLILAEPVYHGRVQSLVMIAFSAQSLVAFPLGALADQIGLREMHGYMAAATVLVVVWSVIAGRSARRQTEAARGRAQAASGSS